MAGGFVSKSPMAVFLSFGMAYFLPNDVFCEAIGVLMQI